VIVVEACIEVLAPSVGTSATVVVLCLRAGDREPSAQGKKERGS
jgi:hypothetical protein